MLIWLAAIGAVLLFIAALGIYFTNQIMYIKNGPTNTLLSGKLPTAIMTKSFRRSPEGRNHPRFFLRLQY